jgi:histidine triad (HIT) family protein
MPEPDCIFCQIAAGDVPAQVVDSDEHTIAFMDISPGTRGHALVIPREHHEDLYSIDADTLARTARGAQRLALRMRDRLGADGVNVINACRPAAWQTVFHFHLHVIPRYDSDPLTLPWTPEPGDPDDIARTAEELRA